MTGDEKVVCGRHGETPPTFVCVHLLTGVACGFHRGTDPDWPDAWCDRCEDALGDIGWTDEAFFEQMRTACTHCWEEVRKRNERIPPLARGKGARFTDAEREAFVEHAVGSAQAVQERMAERWKLSDYARWDFDSRTSRIVFSDPKKPPLIANVRLVGSFSRKTSTFQWSWVTDERTGETVEAVRVFGVVRGIPELTIDNRECDEAIAWSMTAIAGYVLGCEGFYRMPSDHLYWFMLLDAIRLDVH